jgi:hypothetical protein
MLSAWSATTPSWADATTPPDATLWLRLRVRVARRRLDREIGGCLPVHASPARSLRARQLASPSTRRAIAAMLGNILDAAEERQHDGGSELVLEYNAVLEARDRIGDVIELLRSDAPLAPRAVAQALLLATCSDSALFSRSSGKTIGQTLADIADARRMGRKAR